MTQSFHSSRLDEIAEAGPVQPVAFPTGEEVALLRRNLRHLRGQPAGNAREPGAEPAARGRRRAKVG
jgi:hypothetical protein